MAFRGGWTRQAPVPLLLMSVGLLDLACARSSVHSESSTFPSAPTSAVAFIHVNIESMDGKGILTDQVVVVRNDRIDAVGPASEARLPDDAHIIDGTGRYLLPGLVDAHVHLGDDPSVNDAMLRLFLVNGVTTILNLCGTPQHLDLRERVRSGAVLGPQIVTSGRYVNEPDFKTPEEVEHEVEAERRAGFDFIKFAGELSPDAYHRLFLVARREGMRVIGHGNRELGIEAAFRERQDVIAHAEEYLYGYFGFRRPLPEADERRSMIEKIAVETADARTWVMPTLAVYKGAALEVEDFNRVLAAPGMRFVPASLKVVWTSDPWRRRFGHDTVPKFLERYALLQALVKGFQEAGVPLLAGTDAPAHALVPGFSLHDELHELVAAGLTPYEALRSATASAGAFLSGGAFGTIANGKRADLLLLEADPFEDVERASKIVGVMVNGRWRSALDLQGMRDRLASEGATAPMPSHVPPSACAY